MSMKITSLAAAAVLTAGALVATAPAASAGEPVQLTDTQMENVTAGLTRARSFLTATDLRVRNVFTGGSLTSFSNVTTDDSVAGPGGNLVSNIVSTGINDFIVSAVNRAGTLRVDVTNWNQVSEIVY